MNNIHHSTQHNHTTYTHTTTLAYPPAHPATSTTFRPDRTHAKRPKKAQAADSMPQIKGRHQPHPTPPAAAATSGRSTHPTPIPRRPGAHSPTPTRPHPTHVADRHPLAGQMPPPHPPTHHANQTHLCAVSQGMESLLRESQAFNGSGLVLVYLWWSCC